MQRRGSSGVLVAGVVALVLVACAQAAQPHAATSQLLGAKAAMQHQLLAMQASPLESFKQWAVNHGKHYVEDAKEMAHRFAVWMDNLQYVLKHNANPLHTHWLGMNSLADLTQDEYRDRFLGGFNALQHAARNRRPTPFRYADVPEEQLPRTIDWREHNAVAEVKNQAQCGSCWAFSTTGAMEGINAIVTKELISLSEQELVDCDTEQDQGCNGGLMDNAFEFVIKNKGIDTEEDYPYTAMNGQCIASKKRRHVVTIDGYEDVPENDEVSLKKAAAHQPISVAIEADQKAFQLYMGGVFSDESCGTSLDHGVLVVGYGTEAHGATYWIVKNSWGPEWGEHGYIRLRAGVKAKEGLCGIAMAASYPVKTGPNPPKPGPDPPGPAPGPGPTPGPGPSPGPSPPPTPGPVDCDDVSQCPEGTTCCCVMDFLNMCLQWGCCPIQDAVCCEDKQHCCPPTLPVCDTQGGRCLPAQGVTAGAQPWLTKTPATRDWSRLTRWFGRSGKCGMQHAAQQQQDKGNKQE